MHHSPDITRPAPGTVMLSTGDVRLTIPDDHLAGQRIAEFKMRWQGDGTEAALYLCDLAKETGGSLQVSRALHAFRQL